MKTTNLTIESDRLLLRSISLDYKEEIFKEFTPEITQYMFPASPKKIEETIEFITGAIKGNEDGSDLQIVVLKKETQEFLGCGGIHRINTTTPEFGVWIKKPAHGNGFGREAVIALHDWAQDNLAFDYLLYPVVEVNIASRKIPELLGGEIAREYDRENLSGVNQHLIEYRIYKK